jgi:hypothetical protein
MTAPILTGFEIAGGVEPNTFRFTDERVDEIKRANSMTKDERDYLLEYLPTFEECSHKRVDLETFNDHDLIQHAVWIWTDYCRNQGLI